MEERLLLKPLRAGGVKNQAANSWASRHTLIENSKTDLAADSVTLRTEEICHPLLYVFGMSFPKCAGIDSGTRHGAPRDTGLAA